MKGLQETDHPPLRNRSSEKTPQTDSIRELAAFWDSHDLTDYEDQMEEVTEPVFERAAVLEIHLKP